MKKSFLFLVFLFVVILSSCEGKATSKQGVTGVTTVEFKQKIFDFKEVAEGEIVTHSFYFMNTGGHSFVIKNIETGCGCTTVAYTKEPVAPGKEGKIEIAFNSSGRYGKQYKEIRIFANISEQAVALAFSANVK